MISKRRGFLKAGTSASIGLGIPDIIPSSALGNDGRPAPSNRVVMAGIGLGNNNFLANELNSLQTLTGFFSNGRYNFSVNDQFLFYSLSEDFEYTNNNIGFLSLAGPSKQFRLLPLTSNDIEITDTNKTKISKEIILDFDPSQSIN